MCHELSCNFSYLLVGWALAYLVLGILVLMALEKVWEVFLVLHLQTLVQELDLVLAEIFLLISELVLSHTHYIHHDFGC